MNEEQIKDIFEQEIENTGVWFGAIDGCYHSVETAMLATIRRVKKSIKDDIVAHWMKNDPTDTKGIATARFNTFFGPFFDEKMKGNCPNCGTPHYLSPIGLDQINCELCQPED